MAAHSPTGFLKGSSARGTKWLGQVALRRRKANVSDKKSSNKLSVWRGFTSVWTSGSLLIVNFIAAASFALAIGLLYRAMTDTTITIAVTSLPKDLSDRGYTADTIALRLQEEIHKIVDQSNSVAPIRDIQMPSDQTKFVVPHTDLSVDFLAEQTKYFMGFHSHSRITAEVKQYSNKTFIMTLRLDDKVIAANNKIIRSNIEMIFEPAAKAVIEKTNPYIFAKCAYNNDMDKSITVIDESIESASPNDKRISLLHYFMALHIANEGQMQEAIEHLKNAVDIDPDSALYHGHLGKLLYMNGKIDDALISMRKAAKFDPRNSVWHYNFGALLHETGNLDDASLQFQNAMELLHSSNVSGRQKLDIYYGSVEENDALFFRNNEIQFDPDDILFQSLIGLSICYLKQGRHEAAFEALERAAERNPENPDSYLMRAYYLTE